MTTNAIFAELGKNVNAGALLEKRFAISCYCDEVKKE